MFLLVPFLTAISGQVISLARKILSCKISPLRWLYKPDPPSALLFSFLKSYWLCMWLNAEIKRICSPPRLKGDAIVNFSSLFSCPAHNLLFWLTLTALIELFSATAENIFNGKAIKTHCTLPAQQQQNWKIDIIIFC